MYGVMRMLDEELLLCCSRIVTRELIFPFAVDRCCVLIFMLENLRSEKNLLLLVPGSGL